MQRIKLETGNNAGKTGKYKLKVQGTETETITENDFKNWSWHAMLNSLDATAKGLQGDHCAKSF